MNKKIWLGLAVLTVMLVLGGAWVFAAVSGDALSYYPVAKLGNKWEYQLVVAGQNVGMEILGVVQPDGNNLLVGVAVNGKPQAVIYFQESDKGLVRVKEISQKDVINYNPSQLWLPSKMEVGKKWDWTSEDGKMKESDSVIQPQDKITVPAGNFETLLVSSEGVDSKGVSYTDKAWFAKGIGMVREEYSYGGKLMVLQLNRYQVN